MSTLKYSSEQSSAGPEMINGVRASSIRIESTSSTMAKLNSRCDIPRVELHIVAQIVEAEFVVGAVGNVGGVVPRRASSSQSMHDAADCQAKKFVDLPIQAASRLGQVIVYRDHMDAFADQGVEVDGQGRYQGLALTGFHLGDLALMQNDPPRS